MMDRSSLSSSGHSVAQHTDMSSSRSDSEDQSGGRRRRRSINSESSPLIVTTMNRKRTESVSVLVYVLVLVFAWASWIDINGLWVEVPLLVNELPEGWNLPSYLVIIIQVANAGPILYTVSKRLAPNKVKEWKVVYIIIIVGAIASILLALLWDRTSVVGGTLHSTALISLTAFLALVDCTSSVVFLPYMATFKPQYMTAFYVGEGLSGLLPGFVGLIQGVGADPVCVNKTEVIYNETLLMNVTETHSVAVYSPARFSICGFFFFLFVMICLSGIAFSLLHFLPRCKKEKVSEVSKSDDPPQEQNDSEGVSIEQRTSLKKSQFITLLVFTAWANALVNGVLPSTQSYSAIPYGNLAYTLAVRLATIANPLVCFLALFFRTRSIRLLWILTVSASGLASFQLYLASSSPDPPLKGEVWGIVLVVLTQVLLTGAFSYLKVTCASLLNEHDGQRALLWCGVITQLGSFLGALIIFLLINVFHLFQSASVC